MNIGKTKRIIKRPDQIPVIIPVTKPTAIPQGIPAPTWPTRIKEPALIPHIRGIIPTKGV